LSVSLSGSLGLWLEADGNGLQQVTAPVAVKLLAFIHDSAFAEDGLSGFGAGGEGGNPFETGNPDLRQQSDLLENSPLRARQMIVAAGRDPRLFGLWRGLIVMATNWFKAWFS